MDRDQIKQALIDKNPKVWAQIYDHYYGLIKRVLRDEDIAHDTMAEVFKSIERYNPEYRVTQWVFGIAKNLQRSKFTKLAKSGKSLDSLLESDSGYEKVFLDEKLRTPLTTAVKKEILSQFNKAVDMLSPQHKEPFLLYYKERLGTPEIAGKLNLSEKDVLNRVNYARKLLRDKLAGYYSDQFLKILGRQDKRLVPYGVIERYVVKEYKRVCNMFFIKKEKLEVVAKIVSLPKESVKFRLERGLMQMKPYLTDEQFKKFHKMLDL